MTEEYTIVIQGTVSFEEANPSTPGCEIRIMKNNSIETIELFSGDGTNVDFFLGIQLSLVSNDIIHIDLFAPTAGPLNSVLTLETVSLFSLTEVGGTPSSIVQAENFIPNIERKKYLVGVLAHYGLMIRTDDVTKEVEIKPLDEVADDIEQDWSDDLDVGGDKGINQELALTGYARNNDVEYLEDLSVVRTDANGRFTSQNQILSLNKIIISFPYAASDDSLVLPRRIPLINLPFISTEITGFVGQTITFTGQTFTLPTNELLDFHVGHYILISDFPNGNKEFYIDSKSSPTSGTALGPVPASASAYGISQVSFNNKQPRCAIIRTVDFVRGAILGDPVEIFITDGNNIDEDVLLDVDTHRVAHFLDSMRANNILDQYYSTLIATVLNPQLIQAWFAFSASTFVLIDLFRPVYIAQFNARYFINKIDQFKTNESVRVDLIRIDETGDEVTFNVTALDPKFITSPNQTVTVDGETPPANGVKQPFNSGSTLLHEAIATFVDATAGYTMKLINDLSGTTIKEFSFGTIFVGTPRTQTIIPKDEVLWDGGDIYATLTLT